MEAQPGKHGWARHVRRARRSLDARKTDAEAKRRSVLEGKTAALHANRQ